MSMDQHQTSEIAAMAVGVHGHRELDTTDFAIWHEILSDLSFSLARDATLALLRENVFMTPGAVRVRYLDMARQRLAAVEQKPVPPSGLDPAQYQAFVTGWHEAVIDGRVAVSDPDGLERVALSAVGMAPEELAPRTESVPTSASTQMVSPPTDVISGAVVDRAKEESSPWDQESPRQGPPSMPF